MHQLPIFPLLQHHLICKDGIIADAKSGTSGAGRSAKEANLYCEVTEGIHAYGMGGWARTQCVFIKLCFSTSVNERKNCPLESVPGHRHVPEIEQIMRDAIGNGNNKDKGTDDEEEAVITFTPHLMPMSRGMLSTM